MKQVVEITALADRHATLHGRSFAESFSVVIEAGSLIEVLTRVAEEMTNPLFSDLDVGRYNIVVGEPFT